MIEYWYMFPIAVLFSTIAMATGVGGAAMFTPFFFLILKLPAAVAVGTGLFIEVFGFGSGLLGFAKRKLIEYTVGFQILLFTIPAALIGSSLGKSVPDFILMGFLSLMLLILGMVILKPDTKTLIKFDDLHKDCKHEDGECHVKPDNPREVGTLSFMGGLFAGSLSAGVGEVNDFILLKKYKMHGPKAAGTSVFIVALTVLAGSMVHGYNFIFNQTEHFMIVWKLLAFSIPGVLLGAQLGIKVAQRLTDRDRDKLIGLLFLGLAIVTLTSLLFG